jgi:hypothetical protein
MRIAGEYIPGDNHAINPFLVGLNDAEGIFLYLTRNQAGAA